MNLSADQKLAIKKLERLKCGALFMKMGTGKTCVAVNLINTKASEIDCVIWIAPASLLREKSYIAEIEKWKPLSPIYYFSIEGIGSSDVKFLKMLDIASSNIVFCVVDESITIKNTEAGRTRRLLEHYNQFNYRLILNGTPLTQGLIDLYSQIHFLSPKILKMTETQFAHNFLTFKKEGYKPWKRWSKPGNEEALIEILRPYIFDAELDIPVQLVQHTHRVHLSEEEAKNYEEQKRDFLFGKYEIDFLSVAQHFQHIYTTNCREKVHKLKSITRHMDKVIIYIKFLDEVECLRDLFDCIVFTGKEKGDLNKFKGSTKFLICTYGVGSLGLNLQFANNIIFYSQTFDYKDKIQATHRIYRIGQTRRCHIHNFWVNTGLESLIEKSLNKKSNVLSNVNKLISAEEAIQL